MRTTDQYFAYNGATDRYDWKLIGRKEMFVPYNTYDLTNKSLKYADILDEGTVNPKYMRYELHRVWVVEATQKAIVNIFMEKECFIWMKIAGLFWAKTVMTPAVIFGELGCMV